MKLLPAATNSPTLVLATALLLALGCQKPQSPLPTNELSRLSELKPEFQPSADFFNPGRKTPKQAFQRDDIELRIPIARDEAADNFSVDDVALLRSMIRQAITGALQEFPKSAGYVRLQFHLYVDRMPTVQATATELLTTTFADTVVQNMSKLPLPRPKLESMQFQVDCRVGSPGP